MLKIPVLLKGKIMNRKKYTESVTLGQVKQNPQISLQPYDTGWIKSYREEEERIKTALQEKALLIEHVGSTSVPGLSFKPIIDILLLVRDSSKEDDYVPNLITKGYVLRIREPEWYEHRMFKSKTKDINLHVFSLGCKEAQEMLNFRNWLRINDHDRLQYEAAKQELVSKKWQAVQEYADAKTPIVKRIKERANNYFS
ncbi:GrpB family protein [Oenococcus oeni]|uniref:GrpB family protein n=1 Tax=Oenococcus oeni TaxID=1247 RepID=UPI000BDF7B33|nr:GrpB family protein [Oenococcus oeni]